MLSLRLSFPLRPCLSYFSPSRGLSWVLLLLCLSPLWQLCLLLAARRTGCSCNWSSSGLRWALQWALVHRFLSSRSRRWWWQGFAAPGCRSQQRWRCRHTQGSSPRSFSQVLQAPSCVPEALKGQELLRRHQAISQEHTDALVCAADGARVSQEGSAGATNHAAESKTLQNKYRCGVLIAGDGSTYT